MPWMTSFLVTQRLTQLHPTVIMFAEVDCWIWGIIWGGSSLFSEIVTIDTQFMIRNSYNRHPIACPKSGWYGMFLMNQRSIWVCKTYFLPFLKLSWTWYLKSFLVKHKDSFILLIGYRAQFVYAPGQWEMMLHCNVISHWLGTYTKWSLWTVLT